MKNYIKISTVIIFILILSQSASAVDYWLRVPTPITSWLYRCAFPDTLNGWAVGDSGKILHTSNGGDNWQLQNSTINFFIEDVFFINKRLGWAIANDFYFFGTTILKTTNGGVNWSASRYPDTTLMFFTVHFLDSLTGYLGGYTGSLFKTTNAGYNWSKCYVDSNTTYMFPIWRISFYNHQHGVACGGVIDISGVIWQTTNAGLSWKSLAIAPEPLYDVKWLDSQRVYITGGDFEYGGSIVKSYDRGREWTYETMNLFGVGRSLAFRTDYELWVPLGFSQRFGVSIDTGNTWIEVSAPDSTAVYDAVFVDSTHGWAVGTNGAIYKFNKSIIGVNNQHQNNLPSEDRLSQNYPNPFNPSTTIRYSLTRHTRVKITLFDMLGREVRVLLEDIKDPGEHLFEFNASGLSSGVYFYRIEAGNYTEIKKMVLLK